MRAPWRRRRSGPARPRPLAAAVPLVTTLLLPPKPVAWLCASVEGEDRERREMEI